MSSLLSFDQASHTSGYSYFENGKLIKIGHFTCSNPDLGLRLYQFRTKVSTLLSDFNPDEVVFEDIQLQERVAGKKNTDSVLTFKTLAKVQGVLQEVLAEKNIPYTTIIPNVWKSTFNIAGKGRQQEKQMAQKWVSSNYKIDCSEDEADSVCIGVHLIKKRTSEFDWS